MYVMPKLGDENLADRRLFISLALDPEEGMRYLEVLRRALQRDPQSSKTKIIRALFRFPGSDPNLVPKEDRDYFFHGKAAPDDEMPNGTVVDQLDLNLNDPITEKRLAREAARRKAASQAQKPQKRAGGK